MHAKFQVAGFQNKRDIRHPSFDYVCLFFLGHLLVHVTLWFLASDGSEIIHLPEYYCILNITLFIETNKLYILQILF